MSGARIRILILVATVALTWVALAVGAEPTTPKLEVGDVATRDYVARRDAEVIDEATTAALREEAAASVEPTTVRNFDVEDEAKQGVETLFLAVTSGVLAEPAPSSTTTVTEPAPTSTTTTSTTVAEETGTDTTTTTTTAPPQLEFTELVGSLFVDVEGDGVFDVEPGELGLPDAGLPGVTVEATGIDGSVYKGETQTDGSFVIEVPVGDVVLTVDTRDPEFPANFSFSTENATQELECREGRQCAADPIGVAPMIRPLDAQVAELRTAYGTLREETLRTLVAVASADVVRRAIGQPEQLTKISEAVLQRLDSEFERGIGSVEDLTERKSTVIASPPLVVDENGQRDLAAQAAAADIVALFLQRNVFVDEQATAAARQRAREGVPDETVTFEAGKVIVAEGDTIENEIQLAAIEATGADAGDSLDAAAMAAVLVVIVALLGFYLARFRPQFWQRPRMVGLLGLLIVLAAGSVRLTVALQESTSWYILPAVAFGYLAAVLFDARMGALMALTMAILTAVGTRELGVTVFALLATMAPIGFVSAVSTRRAFRNSVVISAVAVGLIAGAVSWFFDSGADTTLADIGQDVAWAFAAGVVSALVALAALPFFEALFDITTTLRILELTDRNHEALQLIQEKAFGTFNHSLMVGTLADAAARAIGANNLLARAAAYYHDIGKTENPTYFIENQFGIPNPHDSLPPEQSAEIIRRHVLDGVRLAKKFKIPSEVAEGITSHHGDAIMRYFYEKARELYGDENVDPDDYRHAGHKPQTKEMAIVMLADSVEGACRANFGEQEPTAEAIEKVVNRVVDEKLDDGQLSEAPLTMAELTKIRKAFIDAMVGHYHQRIPYPNFPGS